MDIRFTMMDICVMYFTYGYDVNSVIEFEGDAPSNKT